MARGNIRIEIRLHPEVAQGIERLAELLRALGTHGQEAGARATEALETIAVPSERAAEAMRSLGIRLSGLSTVEIDMQEVAHHSNCQCARCAPNPTACARCLYYSGSGLLPCAMHPLGRPGAECGDWEDGATEAAKAWRVEGQQRSLEAECSASVHVTADLAIRMDEAAENARYIAQQRENEAAWIEAERRRSLNPEGRFSPEAVQLAIDSPLTPEEAEALIQEHGIESARRVGELRCQGWTIAQALEAERRRSHEVDSQLVCRGEVLAEIMSDGSVNHFAEIPEDAAFGEVQWSTPTAPTGGPTNSPEHEPGGGDRGEV